MEPQVLVWSSAAVARGRAVWRLRPNKACRFGRVESPHDSHVPLTRADGHSLPHISRHAGEVIFSVHGDCLVRNRSALHELVARRWELTSPSEIPLPAVPSREMAGLPQPLAPGRWLVRNGRHGVDMTDPAPEQTAWLVVDVPKIRRTRRSADLGGDTAGELEAARPEPPAWRPTPAELSALEAYFGEFTSWPPHRNPAMRSKDHAAEVAGGRPQHQALSTVLRKAKLNGYPHDRAGEALWAWLVQRHVVTPAFPDR